MHRVLFTVAVAVASLFGVVTTASAQAPGPGYITVVHGVRGLVADVYVDGQRVLQTFQPERTTQPLEVAAGAHDVQVREAGAAPDAPPVLSWTVVVAPGAHVSAVVHLDQAGSPMVTTFDDDVSRVSAGTTRLVVRHVAAAPPIDVRAGDQVVATGLANAVQAQATLTPASYSLAVTPTGTQDALVAPQDVLLPEGSATFLYLIGAQADSSLGWIAQRVDGLQSAPRAIQTGDSGLAATTSGVTPIWMLAGFALAALLAGAATTWQLRRPRPTPLR